MSQAPDIAVDPNAATDYATAWSTVLDWTYEGRSWSGREKHCCFLNLGDETFADVSAISGLNYDDDGRGVGVVDWDHDGRLDLWISGRTAPQIRFLRNEIPSKHHFLALHLTGVDCNRDAVGTRVELTMLGDDGQPVRLVKSVKAGEGFLSQSSKWLHFGLGVASSADAAAIQSVDIFWPDGSQQSLADVGIDQHLLVRQGESPLQWSRPTRAKLTASVPELPESPSAINYTFAMRRPLPAMEVITPSAERQPLTLSGNPRLVLLWASWCAPCAKELQELRDHQPELTAAGLEILALSVDGLGDDGSFQAALDAAQTWKLPFPVARATREGLDQLQWFNNTSFMTQRPLPLPTSFLLDAKGRVAAIYKGPVSLPRLLADLERLPLQGAELLSAVSQTIGLMGRWAVPPAIDLDAYLVSRGRTQYQAGDWQEAEAVFQQALQLEPKNSAAEFFLGLIAVKKQDMAGARKRFESAVETQPRFAAAHLQLGDLSLGQRDFAAAQKHYETVTSLESNSQAEGKLGLIYAIQGQLLKAEPHFRAAADLNPADADALGNHGKVLLDLKRYAEAAQQLTSAVDREQPPLAAMLNLSWIRAAAPDADQRDGPQAVELAKRCAELTRYQDATCLDRLAAAYAENGDFDQAAKYAQSAIRIATASRRPTRDLVARQRLYQQQQAFRLPAGN